MLASIHPLGERARGQQFRTTLAAFTIGSAGGAAAFGALFGGLGALGNVGFGSDSTAARAAILGVGAVFAAIVDQRGRRVPSVHRQVNEDWLGAYRGWIYGAGFGAQLGVGVLTIVTTASVYLTWLAAAMTADPFIGAAVGAGFGLARAAPLFASSALDSPGAVAARVQSVDSQDGRFRTVTVWAEAMTAFVAAMVAFR